MATLSAGSTNARLDDERFRLTLDESVYALLMQKGYAPEYGARPMERLAERFS